MASTDALAMAVSPASDARAPGAPDAASMPGSARSIASSRSMAACSVGSESRTRRSRDALASARYEDRGREPRQRVARADDVRHPGLSAQPVAHLCQHSRIGGAGALQQHLGGRRDARHEASLDGARAGRPSARQAEPQFELAQRRRRHDEGAHQHDDHERRDRPGGEEAGGERRPGVPRRTRGAGGQPAAGPEGAPSEDRQQRGQERDRHDDADDGREGERGGECAEEVNVAHQQRRRPERRREAGRQDDCDHVGARSDRGLARSVAAQPGAHREQIEDRVVGHDADEERGDHRLDVPARGDPGGLGDGADRVEIDHVRDRDRAQHHERRDQRAEDDRHDQGDQGQRHADHQGEPVVDGLDLLLPGGRRAGEARARAGRHRGRGDVVAAEAGLAGDRGGLGERQVGEHRGRALPGAGRDAAGAGERHGRGDLLEAGHPAAAHVESEPREGHLLGGAQPAGTAHDHLGARDQRSAEDVRRPLLGGERRGVVGQRELQVRRPPEPGQGHGHHDRRGDPPHHDDVAQRDDRAAE